ncbi:hypothetical protein CRM22_007883 [Opisthorchis felineus]|uniref:Protein-tyrosine sulfotransferase n=1 Tax=Opisthorchis felineus TaxID=147828 RepID=A0A4S2LKV2_OPIFE|nr:hypothetical protein CRM22_007883 [Opisthorchis felineus]
MSAARYRRGKTVLVILFILSLMSTILLMSTRRAECECDSSGDPPLIFISGQQSSGTGLVRVLLDSHPMINCGAEPIYSMHVLALREDIQESPKDWLIKANIYPKAIDQATKAFIRELAVNMVDKAPIYCQKQPLLFRYLNYLAAQFPKAKYVHVLRDGRAAIASTIDYEASTKQFSREINTDSLSKWASPESVLPDWFKAQAADYSSLLHELQYDRIGVPPDYSKLPEVLPHIQ